MFSGSSIIKLGEKMSIYSFYSLVISNKDFSYYKKTNNRICKGYVESVDSEDSMRTTWMTKVLAFFSSAIPANSHLSISSTLLVVNKVSVVV